MMQTIFQAANSNIACRYTQNKAAVPIPRLRLCGNNTIEVEYVEVEDEVEVEVVERDRTS